ncbi:uncharacterized protein TNCV_1969381 [Trichonephila clavipes]|nr:uncharacterized protein TNCV_1969381 [Trichonephila clavipes]
MSPIEHLWLYKENQTSATALPSCNRTGIVGPVSEIKPVPDISNHLSASLLVNYLPRVGGFNSKSGLYIHWCANIKDEVEKLAYQLNEDAEWTERPIRRLSKVMYGSTCTDMQVDVMGECLSSIKHVVGVRSVFLAKRLHAV